MNYLDIFWQADGVSTYAIGLMALIFCAELVYVLIDRFCE